MKVFSMEVAMMIILSQTTLVRPFMLASNRRFSQRAATVIATSLEQQVSTRIHSQTQQPSALSTTASQSRSIELYRRHHHHPSTSSIHRRFAHISSFDDDLIYGSKGDGEGADEGPQLTFQPGDKVQVEILSFGPLGASVDVVAASHNPDRIIPASAPPLGKGLILQKEISYYRQGRGGVDVLRGEVLPAYIEKIRELRDWETARGQTIQKYDICLRQYGGKAKAASVATQIMERLEWTNGGTIPIGDKSSPDLIAEEFPGVSKGAFKKAVSSLYKAGKVQPGPHSITLMQLTDNNKDTTSGGEKGKPKPKGRGQPKKSI